MKRDAIFLLVMLCLPIVWGFIETATQVAWGPSFEIARLSGALLCLSIVWNIRWYLADRK